ncbi:MAG: sugar-specific transcriptional regulator TrmB, partial [Haloquadratum walsbyi J07HQW2]
MSKTTGDPERAINGLLSVAQLLEEPRLARLYTYILREGEVTIDEIVADTDTPRTTAYADTGTLVDLGVLTRDETQKTHTYTLSQSRSLRTSMAIRTRSRPHSSR